MWIKFTEIWKYVFFVRQILVDSYNCVVSSICCHIAACLWRKCQNKELHSAGSCRGPGVIIVMIKSLDRTLHKIAPVNYTQLVVYTMSIHLTAYSEPVC